MKKIEKYIYSWFNHDSFSQKRRRECTTLFTRRHTAKSLWTNSPASSPHKDLFICPLEWQGQSSISPLHQDLLCYFNPFLKKKSPSLSLDKFESSSSSLSSSAPLPFPYSILWWQSGHYTIFTLSANPPTSPHTSALPSVLPYHPSPFAELLWAILLWPRPINLLQLDNDL